MDTPPHAFETGTLNASAIQNCAPMRKRQECFLDCPGLRRRSGLRRRTGRFLLRTLVLIVAILGSMRPAPAQRQDAQTGEGPLDVTEVAPGVFVHFGVDELMSAGNQGAIANVGFVVGDAVVAVIDTGGSVREGRRLLAAIRAVTQKPVRFVINTHAHPDHVFGNAAFSYPEVVFVGHRNLPRALSERGPHYISAFRHNMGDILDDVELIAPQQTIDGEASLDLGNRVLTLRAWRVAHSDSDLTVFDATTQTLFTGDLVFLRHIPVVDGSLRGWLASLAPLAALPARRAVPGHGPAAPWPAALDDERRYLERLAQDCRAMIAAGTPLAVAVQTAGLVEKSHWDLFQEYNARNATAAFAELEWE